MAKLVLGDITNITGNESSATATINANNQSTEDALENTLSRDGTSPNEMNADFDMNGYDIINAGTINAEACFIDGQDIASFVGAEGPPGPQGPPGSNGTNGEDGEDGAAATISVGTVTTGSAGSNVIVTNVGTTSAAVLDFTIPRGDTGAQGIQGIQGIQGPAGNNGSDGADGVIASIVAGTGISVDDTDPANPIVSATGGAGLVDGDYGDITVSGTGTVMSIDAGVIVNADVNASAAIAVSKLAAVTASRALVSDGSGFVSPATTTSTEIGYVNGVTSSIQTQLNGKQTSDTTLTALAAYNTNGLLTQTAADTFTGRTLTGPAAGISVSNGNGVSGNPTLSLANDLSALEALASTGIAVRTTTDTWTQRTITGTSNEITVTNGDGVSGNPTLSLHSGVYRASGTDVALADGGTGASLTDPNADRIMFWDDSAGAVTWLTAGTGLSITGTTIDAAGGSGLTLGTYTATTSGSTITFSSIPASVKQITLSWINGSTNGSGDIDVQIGDSGGLETSGYTGRTTTITNTPSVTLWTWSNGVPIVDSSTGAAGNSLFASIVLTLIDASTNTWAIQSNVTTTASAGNPIGITGTGFKSLSATLDRIALITANTFDAGNINIVYGS